MLKKMFSWISSNKLLTVLFLVFLFFIYHNFFNSPTLFSARFGMGLPTVIDSDMEFGTVESAASPMYTSKMRASMNVPYPDMYGGSTDVNAPDRKVVTESHLSLLVKDVRQSVDAISQQVDSFGGFIVNSSVNQPEEGGSGNISLRVPVEKATDTLSFLRSISVRVVSENIHGNDVTDQYKDIEARLATLAQTKQTFEQMLSSANDVDEILSVQKSIFAVQDQIDALKGQQNYLENTSSTVLIQAYLSTDELSLPFSPADPWRPQVVFKTAVRSLVGNLRHVAELIIWGVVYMPVLAILSFIFFLVNSRIQHKFKNS